MCVRGMSMHVWGDLPVLVSEEVVKFKPFEHKARNYSQEVV